jgi:hypothetical protein
VIFRIEDAKCCGERLISGGNGHMADHRGDGLIYRLVTGKFGRTSMNTRKVATAIAFASSLVFATAACNKPAEVPAAEAPAAEAAPADAMPAETAAPADAMAAPADGTAAPADAMAAPADGAAAPADAMAKPADAMAAPAEAMPEKK